MATLFEMTQQANTLYELLQNEEIDEQIFNDTLEAMGTEEKIESYCQIISYPDTLQSFEIAIKYYKKHPPS